jgi:ABC-type amino acid transport substrate-binding protein
MSLGKYVARNYELMFLKMLFSQKLTRSQFLRYFFASLSTAGILAACQSNNQKAIVVATDPTFAPFEFQGIGGELEGFDIDLMKAISEAAGLSVKFQSLPFDGMIPALQANTIDAGISAITITEERAKTISFSRPYFKAGLAIAVRENNTNITSIDSLKNQKIAAQIGTTGAQKAKSIPGAQVRIFDTAPTALQELANGNVEAVINDAPATLYAISTAKLKGIKIVGQILTEEFYGIATPKNSQYLDEINAAIAKLLQNGTYALIYQKWFNAQPPQLPETVPGFVAK